MNVLEEVKKLHLPKDKAIVFGSAPMAIVGIREVKDIDIFVTPEVYQSLKQEGWKENHLEAFKSAAPCDVLQNGFFEVGTVWNYGDYNPSFQYMLEHSSEIEGMRVANLLEVKKWKIAFAREKDLRDVALIDVYLKDYLG